MFTHAGVAATLTLLLSVPALAGPTIYSPPLRVDGDNEIVCRIRNIGTSDVIVQIAIVRVFDGVEVEVGGEEILAPGRGTARGALSNAGTSACEFRMIKGNRKRIRASASIQGPPPDRTTFATIEAW